MKSVKHMTKSQCLRIQQNNYCSEHDRNGKQFDYEANGYRDAIDQRLWELTTKNLENMLKRNTGRATRVIDENPLKKALVESNNQLDTEIEQLDIQLSVMRAFNSWRYLGNELMMNYGIDK